MCARLSSIKIQAFESMLNSTNVSYRNTTPDCIAELW